MMPQPSTGGGDPLKHYGRESATTTGHLKNKVSPGRALP
jgi:hypothetical protein